MRELNSRVIVGPLPSPLGVGGHREALGIEELGDADTHVPDGQDADLRDGGPRCCHCVGVVHSSTVTSLKTRFGLSTRLVGIQRVLCIPSESKLEWLEMLGEGLMTNCLSKVDLGRGLKRFMRITQLGYKP